jgi:hypothetical protein
VARCLAPVARRVVILMTESFAALPVGVAVLPVLGNSARSGCVRRIEISPKRVDWPRRIRLVQPRQVAGERWQSGLVRACA